MKKYNNFINGKFVPASNGAVIKVINPATEEVISEVPDSTDEDANKAVEAAYSVRKEWARLPAIERADYIRKLTKGLKDNKDLFAKTVCEEQGKIFGLAQGEVEFAVSLMEFAAEWARRIEGEIIRVDKSKILAGLLIVVGKTQKWARFTGAHLYLAHNKEEFRSFESMFAPNYAYYDHPNKQYVLV